MNMNGSTQHIKYLTLILSTINIVFWRKITYVALSPNETIGVILVLTRLII